MMYSNKNILIVDDSKPMRHLLKLALINIEFPNISESEDGKQALDKLSKLKIDLVLMDWNMPKMSGIECLKEMKNNENYSDIPVIMVTTESDCYRLVEAIQSGAASYILKPISENELKEKIISAFEGN